MAAQRWADLSEGNYGVSLMNDCKYGYDCKDNVLRISLLRASIIPDPNADEGKHEFTYSLYPHDGDWRVGGSVQNAAELNHPLTAVNAGKTRGDLPSKYSWIQIAKPNVLLDTVKKAEDNNDIVLRLYEAYGCRGPVDIAFTEKPKMISECNLMERENKPLRLSGNKLKLSFTPFEIKTLRVEW